MATQVGQIAVATKFEKAITGAEQIAVVTPTTVRKRPCESAIRTQESDYTYIQYMVMSNRRIRGNIYWNFMKLNAQFKHILDHLHCTFKAKYNNCMVLIPKFNN